MDIKGDIKKTAKAVVEGKSKERKVPVDPKTGKEYPMREAGVSSGVKTAIAKIAEAVAKKGTQAGHHVTDGKNVVKSIENQQAATVAKNSKLSNIEKSISELETKIKGNADRAAQLAKQPKSPGAPADREAGLLDANKALQSKLKDLRQSYHDTKSSW